MAFARSRLSPRQGPYGCMADEASSIVPGATDVAHYGTFLHQTVGGCLQAAGRDVILAHRLLKNRVPRTADYVLFTLELDCGGAGDRALGEAVGERRAVGEQSAVLGQPHLQAYAAALTRGVIASLCPVGNFASSYRDGAGNSLNGLNTFSPGQRKSRSFPVTIVRP